MDLHHAAQNPCCPTLTLVLLVLLLLRIRPYIGRGRGGAGFHCHLLLGATVFGVRRGLFHLDLATLGWASWSSFVMTQLTRDEQHAR